MARIIVTTFGSTGDLNPFIALGIALRSRGHDVIFAVEANFQEQLSLSDQCRKHCGMWRTSAGHQCSRKHCLCRAEGRGAAPPFRALFRSLSCVLSSDSSRRNWDHRAMLAGRGSFPGGARRSGSTFQRSTGGAAQSGGVDSSQALHDEAGKTRLASALIHAHL